MAPSLFTMVPNSFRRRWTNGLTRGVLTPRWDSFRPTNMLNWSHGTAAPRFMGPKNSPRPWINIGGTLTGTKSLPHTWTNFGGTPQHGQFLNLAVARFRVLGYLALSNVAPGETPARRKGGCLLVPGARYPRACLRNFAFLPSLSGNAPSAFLATRKSSPPKRFSAAVRGSRIGVSATSN
jgi:hypothetical protein